MAFQRYLAEEIATDAADGLITRREALRRLGLLGIGASAAATLLAACGDDDDDVDASATSSTAGGGSTTTTGGSPSTTAPAAVPAVKPERITFSGPRGELKGSFAAAPGAKGAVLVIHENRGLTEHFVNLPGRLAGDGYTALAVDLLSAEGGTDSFSDPAQAMAALGAADKGVLLADLQAGLDELAKRASGQNLAVMGFCFGGGMTWSLLAAKEARLAAAVPFYGTPPDGADFTGVKAAVLAVYAELDARVNATRDAAVAALQKAGVTHEVKTYPGADHAFFNETSPRHNAAAAAEAYQAVLAWFGRHLA